MSRVSGKAAPVDPADVQAHELRVAQRASNGQLQRGIAQAQADTLLNARGAFNQGLADLKRVTLKRDATVPGREAYDRCHQRVTERGTRLKSIVGDRERVLVPAWLPPPGQEDQQMEEIGAPAFDIGEYKETGPKNNVHPVPTPGTAGDTSWFDRILGK